MIKIGQNPQIDKNIVKFLAKALNKNANGMTLQSLLSFSTRLGDNVQDYMGRTISDIRHFVSLFPDELFIDDDNRVHLVDSDGQPIYGPGRSASENIRLVEVKPLTNVSGSVYRILGKYGFIELDPPNEGRVYFDGRQINDGEIVFLRDHGVTEGMKVIVDVTPGPNSAEASYRAKKVTFCADDLDSSSSSTLTESVFSVSDVPGKIWIVFNDHGFIRRSKTKSEDVYFDADCVVIPEGRQISGKHPLLISPQDCRALSKPVRMSFWMLNPTTTRMFRADGSLREFGSMVSVTGRIVPTCPIVLLVIRSMPSMIFMLRMFTYQMMMVAIAQTKKIYEPTRKSYLTKKDIFKPSMIAKDSSCLARNFNRLLCTSPK